MSEEVELLVALRDGINAECLCVDHECVSVYGYGGPCEMCHYTDVCRVCKHQSQSPRLDGENGCPIHYIECIVKAGEVRP